jgi:REP element-mobilizing transposase RayT
MCRGNNGQDIFENDDGHRLFLSTLGEVCQQTGWFIHAYVLMSNHYHLLLETPEPNLVSGMKWFQGAYTQRFNAMFKRRGHLYQGRYKAIPIGTDPKDGGLEYFREVSTYIHLNPFRAKICGEGLVRPLESYKWSSYPAYCGRTRKDPKWLVREKVLKTWGLNEAETGCHGAYRDKLERFMRKKGQTVHFNIDRFLHLCLVKNMPRSIRVQYPGAHYHAMCRGNNGQDIFLNDDGRRLFLSTLAEVVEQTGWCIHAYVLMSNHYHLLLETPEPNLVDGMKWFQSTYTQRFNSMFKRRGHLYQGRYKAVPIGTDPREGGLEYFQQVSTYIHLNPFRAGLYGEGVGAALESYPWSSYPAYCGQVSKAPTWLVKKKVLKTWDLQEGEPGTSRKYREKLERFMCIENDPDAARRGEMDKQIRRGWYLGNEEFRERLDKMLMGHSRKDTHRSSQRKDHGPAEAERLLRLALDEIEWSEEDLLTARSVTPEKQGVAWLLMTQTAVTGTWIAERLQMGHRTNCSRAISRFRHGEEEKIKTLKGIMLKCTV